ARGGLLAGQPEDRADEPLRGLRLGVDGGRLPRLAGGGRPQGRALHDPEIDLHQSDEVLIRVVILALAALVAAAPMAVSQEKIQVVTTSADLKALVEAVAGGRAEVESLAAPEQDPHSVEVKPGQLARLRGAA